MDGVTPMPECQKRRIQAGEADAAVETSLLENA